MKLSLDLELWDEAKKTADADGWWSAKEEEEFWRSHYKDNEIPRFGKIDNIKDAQVAVVQRARCGRCEFCYWDSHCSENSRLEEMIRMAKLSEDKESSPMFVLHGQVTCGNCVYATDTNPRICMCPDGIAKHSYVSDDDYCNKGEGVCVI